MWWSVPSVVVLLALSLSWSVAGFKVVVVCFATSNSVNFRDSIDMLGFTRCEVDRCCLCHHEYENFFVRGRERTFGFLSIFCFPFSTCLMIFGERVRPIWVCSWILPFLSSTTPANCGSSDHFSKERSAIFPPSLIKGSIFSWDYHAACSFFGPIFCWWVLSICHFFVNLYVWVLCGGCRWFVGCALCPHFYSSTYMPNNNNWENEIWLMDHRK